MSIREQNVIVIVAILFLFVAGCGQPSNTEPVDLFSELQLLTKMSSFAERPRGRAHMISSYDRSGGNVDRVTLNGALKDGRDELVNLKGPGCICRIWNTGGGTKNWYFYIDGEQNPRITLTLEELHGGRAPFIKPLADKVSGGYYCYVPIPYNKSLRIEVDREDPTKHGSLYYQINYSKFNSRTDVTSFPRLLTTAQLKEINEVANKWSSLDGIYANILNGLDDKWTDHSLAPSRNITWLEKPDSGLLSDFAMKVTPEGDLTAIERSSLLRLLELRIYWDGATIPSVAVPLGDFFMNSLYRRRYISLPLAYVDGAFICRFPMPFREGVRAEIRNSSRYPVKVSCAYNIDPIEEGKEHRYFHANWSAKVSDGQPYKILNINGSGHYVGCYLSAIGMDGTWMILEGDETIISDGDILQGTGLEDYFNGAYYYTGLFDLPLHGLLEKTAMRTQQYRIHAESAVPFEKEFSLDMEFGEANKSKGYMSAMCYWYQDAPSSAKSNLGQWRFPPRDPLEPHAVMATIAELEHEGLYDELTARVEILAETIKDPTIVEVLNLRGAEYKRIKDKTSVPTEFDFKSDEAKTMQDNLNWFHQKKEHAFFGIQASAGYKLYLDGEPIAEGTSPGEMKVYRMTLRPGMHIVAAETTSMKKGDSLCGFVRTHYQYLYTDESWGYSESKPAGWPGDLEDRSMPKLEALNFTWYPSTYIWQCKANAYPYCHAGKHLIRLWKSWRNKPEVKKLYMFTHVDIPSTDEDS